jgi:hypothetical protein
MLASAVSLSGLRLISDRFTLVYPLGSRYGQGYTEGYTQLKYEGR